MVTTTELIANGKQSMRECEILLGLAHAVLPTNVFDGFGNELHVGDLVYSRRGTHERVHALGTEGCPHTYNRPTEGCCSWCGPLDLSSWVIFSNAFQADRFPAWNFACKLKKRENQGTLIG